MAAADLTTVSDVKQWAQIASTITGDDPLIQRLVSEVSDEVLTMLSRDIFLQAYSETQNGNGARALRTFQWPITAVTSVLVDGIAIPARADASSDGFVFDEKMIYLSGCWTFSRGAQNVVLGYSAGYAQVPLKLREVTTRICALALKRDRAKIGIQSESLAGQQVSYTTDLPKDLQRIIDKMSRVIGR